MNNANTTAIDAAVAPILEWFKQHNVADQRMRADSRIIERGNIFIAMPGVRAGLSEDGRSYIEKAIGRGAAAVVVEAEGWDNGQFKNDFDVPILPVQGLRALSGHLAARHYDWPSRKLFSVGVTGTNGKTSCSHWIAHGLTLSGRRGAVLGTVGCGFPGTGPFWSSRLTTPEAVALQTEICQLMTRDAEAVALEASSIGLAQGRLDSMHFDVAVFTNLTRDHLDYHGDMANYEAAKTKLFDWPDLKYAVINLDDAMGGRLVNHLRARAQQGPLKLLGTSMVKTLPPLDPDLAARFSAHDVRATETGMHFEVWLEQHDAPTQKAGVDVNLVGLFNVTNVLNVFATWHAAGIALEHAVQFAPHLRPPEGRMQFFTAPGTPLVVVDYAHTPDALSQALAALRPLAQVRQGRIWVVFGCGGERDQGKRALMGQAAAGADHILLTNDNPRGEEPRAIIDAIAAGVPAQRFETKTCECIPDRLLAIEHATFDSEIEDVVLLAGKGHETYQEVEGVRYSFSDIGCARQAVQIRHEDWKKNQAPKDEPIQNAPEGSSSASPDAPEPS